MEGKLAEDDWKLLSCRENLANDLYSLGLSKKLDLLARSSDWQEAVDLVQKNLAVCKEVRGDKDRETLRQKKWLDVYRNDLAHLDETIETQSQPQQEQSSTTSGVKEQSSQDRKKSPRRDIVKAHDNLSRHKNKPHQNQQHENFQQQIGMEARRLNCYVLHTAMNHVILRPVRMSRVNNLMWQGNQACSTARSYLLHSFHRVLKAAKI